MSGKRRARFPGVLAFPALLIVATLIAYLPAIRGGFVWDDDFYVTDNATLRTAEGLQPIWLVPSANPQYYPLTFTTFWVEHQLWGNDPLGYHLVNVLLHAASSVLLWLLLRRIGVPGAALAAAIFALHPVEVESVAWVTERKNTLSGVFYLGSALAFFGRTSRSRAGALLLFVCALLSKSVAASLPVVLGLVVFWKERRIERRELGWLAVMLAVGAAAGLFTAHMEQTHVGAEGAEWSLGPAARLLLSGRIFWFYLAKLAWPANLAFFYERWVLDLRSAAQWLYPAGAALLFVLLFALRRRIGTGPLVAFACYGVTIAPALGFLNVFPMRYSWVADHFQYLAGLGPIALAAAAGTSTSARFGQPLRRALGVTLLALLSVLTWRQAGTFRDAESLWRATVARTPTAWAAQAALGNLLDEKGDLDGAALHHLAAIAARPNHVDSMANLAAIRLGQGRPQESIEWCERALRIDPGHTIARYDLAVALAAVGSVDRAIAELRTLIATSPDRALAPTSGMAAVLQERGFLGLPPGKARAGLGHLLAQQGRTDEAIVELRASLHEKDDAPEVWTDLGLLLESQGRAAEAEASYAAALRIAPGFEPARTRLAGLARLRAPQGSVRAQ